MVLPTGHGTTVRADGVEAQGPIVGDVTGADDGHRYVPAGHVSSFSGPVEPVGVTRMPGRPSDRPEGYSRSVALNMAQYSPGSDYTSGGDSDGWVVDQ